MKTLGNPYRTIQWVPNSPNTYQFRMAMVFKEVKKIITIDIL